MDFKHLRRRCEARLKELDVPVPFDAPAFCDELARRRGRPIVLQPAVCGKGFYGLWVATPDADVIFYEQETSALHQEHILVHEVCHLLCGHEPLHVADSTALLALVPELRTAAVQHMLQRAGYSTEEEQEAELLASLILERQAACAPERPAGPAAAALNRRLETSLAERREA